MCYSFALAPALSHPMGEGARRAGEGFRVVYPAVQAVTPFGNRPSRRPPPGLAGERTFATLAPGMTDWNLPRAGQRFRLARDVAHVRRAGLPSLCHSSP